MNKKDKERTIEILDMVSKDAENDATNFDGKEFNGKNVGVYFGNHGASISTLAKIVKGIVEEL